MANASAVTIQRSWDEGSRSGQFIQAARHVDVVLSADGGTAGDMPASLFLLAEIYEASFIRFDAAGTKSFVPLCVEANGAGVMTCSPSTGALADATGTLTMVVKGRAL